MNKSNAAAEQRVDIRLASPKKILRRGERTKFRVTVSGLKALRRPVTLRVENHSPAFVHLKGGESQKIRILASQVSKAGKVVREFEVIAKRPGPFAIGYWLGNMLLAHLDSLTKSWGDHTESTTIEWLGSGHEYKDTREWLANSHEFAESKAWKGHGHWVPNSLNFWGKRRGHSRELTAKWWGYNHDYYYSKKQEEKGHHFEATEKKGWFGHYYRISKIWDEKKHDYVLSRVWEGDRHSYDTTVEENGNGEHSYHHDYDLTRTWDGDRHKLEETTHEKDSRPTHKYEDSRREKGEERDKWSGDEHSYYESDSWKGSGHDYKASIKKRDDWKKDGHWYIYTVRWNERGHDYGASLKEDNEKKKGK